MGRKSKYRFETYESAKNSSGGCIAGEERKLFHSHSRREIATTVFLYSRPILQSTSEYPPARTEVLDLTVISDCFIVGKKIIYDNVIFNGTKANLTK
ncbi:Protein of unknown function [Cotesia congregata]|uniref:Uncharacterized protein n=1 Tax=Cotesia congregata TaxID=51543 RepID=A0A8J2MS72_COTCN|nr:Protein of unknown function [Cotesia congregata]